MNLLIKLAPALLALSMTVAFVALSTPQSLYV